MALGALALAPAPASAIVSTDPARLYVEARAAAMNGNHVRSAELFAALADAQPDSADIARKALSEAIGAGQMQLALGLAAKLPPTKLPTEARLLLASDELKRHRLDRALAWLKGSGENADLSFLAPMLTAWDYAERGDADRAIAAIDQIPANTLLSPLQPEQRALILLKFKRVADAEPSARRAIGTAGAREIRLRLAFADGFLAAGDRARALAMIDGMGSEAAGARQRIAAGKTSGAGIDNASEALSEVLTAFGADLARLQRSAPPIGLVQVARYADPRNSGATTLLALLLEGDNRTAEALALLRSIPRDDPLTSQVQDAQVRVFSENKMYNDAFAIASAAANRPNATSGDYSRLGDVYQSMKRYNEAADAYARAIALANAQGLRPQTWPLLLLQANSFEEAGRWPDTKQALTQALALAPEQPLLLNFMGYSKLEHGEDLDAAEAMIRKANALAPDDASITDSLGWALFKRGKMEDAIATLQKAAEKDPDQAAIQEHLGDALFKSGRRYEARFAWNAALITAEDDVAGRVKAKLLNGLSSSNAAP
ncbi:tetratricopeptide repeat protein [Sphingomonas limnosediminicola]|uniref:Tetratricopeptide repeat protein n=1 Tax=Sphingomonas limnosediminicola TaxID=940133 RepID=A0ABP7KXM6_9SPHN